jgi:Cu(I)/Ag(I) efflux system membrane fusion protein
MSAKPHSNRVRLASGAAVLALIAGAAGFGLAHLGSRPAPAPISVPPTGRKVLYWYDPMVPAQHFDKPGKSPFMNMQLMPRYAGEGPSASGVQIDPSTTQNLGLRLATVQRASFADDVVAPGALEFNQRDVAIVQARAAGFVQRVYGRAPGDLVRAGAPLADLLVPTWGGAQAEYLAVARTGDRALQAAARSRLHLLGMPENLIDQVARNGQAHTVVTVVTPISGAIQTLDVRQGMTVAMGQTLAQVSGLRTVWLTAAVPETLAGQVRIGDAASADLVAFPGKTLSGRVRDILPTAQSQSRTLQVRVELPNPSGRLRPGMFAQVHFNGQAHQALMIPSEAVIRTGKRTIVMLAMDGGRFQPVEVQVGREDNDRTEVLAGLAEGQKVVASGQFLIDSEASLTGIPVRPLGSALAAPGLSAQPTLYQTRGRVEALNADQITFSHQAVPAIGWPAMTMTFKLGSPELSKGLKVGDQAAFAFEQRPDGPVVRRITPEGRAQ